MKNTNFSARLVEKGSLFKVPLFEYEVSQGNQPNKLYRILVWMDNQAIDPAITPVYDYLFYSLGLYHKIDYAYKQGRESYSEARKIYSHLEAKIKEFKPEQPLEELQKLLESMPELSMSYQRQLRNLKAHYTTIKTNQINYENSLQKFWQPGDIPSWKEFSETTCKRYLDQIETYLSYIQPGKDLINEFINTLRGLVAIEQAKCDRDAQIREKENDLELQIVIASVGVGIGVAGVTATAFPYYLKPADKPEKIKIPGNFSLPQNIKVLENFSPHPITQSIIISLAIGFLAYIIVRRVLFYLWGRRWGKFSKKS